MRFINPRIIGLSIAGVVVAGALYLGGKYSHSVSDVFAIEDSNSAPYTPNLNNSIYKPNIVDNNTTLRNLEELERSLDQLNARLECLDDDLVKLSPAEVAELDAALEKLQPVVNRGIDYTSKMVDALREGSVEDKQKRIDVVINEYVCSLPRGLVIDGRNTFEGEAYGVRADPRTIVMRYISYPLEPVDTLFELMGGDSYDYELEKAFEVYVRGAYGLKTSPEGTGTTATISCNEELK